MPQLSTPPPSKKSSGTDFLSFQNKKGRSPSQSPPTLLNRTSVTPESKKNGGFLNKLLRRLSTTKSTGTTSSSSRSARSTVGSKYTGGSSFSTLVSPHFADGKANTNGSGQITPERTRLRKNSVLGRSRSRSRRSSNTNSEHDILDDDRSSMYDDDDNSSTAASSISRASLSLDSVSLESKSNLTYLDEQVGGVKQNNNHTFDFLEFDPKSTINSYDSPSDIRRQWSGITLDSLHVPKYIRSSRRKKHAPRLLSTMFLAQELCATDDSKTKANDDTDSLTSTKSIDDPHYWSNSSDVDLDDSFVSDGSLPNTDRLIDEQIASSSGFKKEISPKGESSKNEIFVMEFSRDGKYLATAGKDSMIRIWKVISSPLARLEYKSYEESHGGSKLNNKSISRNNKSATDVSNRNSCRNENLAGNDDNTNANIDINKDPCVKQLNNSFNGNNSNNSHINNHNDGININHINNGSNNHQASTSRNRRVFPYAPVFHQKPIRVFKGHTHNILSLDWSKNNFLISGSMDRTCKLWHVDRPDCLETFVHEDFVTSVKFHPTDDRFFLSGSLDNRLRLWSILEKNIAYSNDLGDNVLITAVSFTPDGLTCLAGGFNGSLFTLETNGLHILNRYEIKEKHFAKPFHNSNGDKITGIKVFPDLDATEDEDLQVRKSKLADVSIASEEKKDNRGILKSDSIGKWNVLVTTNDSKVRLVNSHKKKLVTRFKGLTNNSSSIVATVSDDHKYIISGSEDHWCYVWENNNSIINNKLKSHLAELLVEGKHHLLDLHNKQRKYSKFLLKQTHLLKKNFSMQKFLAADVDYEYISNENSSYTSFHAHHTKVNAAMFAPQETVKLLELSDDVILDLVKRHNEFSTTSTATIDPGYIIITTDAQGLIKVFRQDSAILIRKKILAARKKWIKKKPTTYTHQFVDDSTDVLSMNGTIDVDGGNESCLLHTVPNCSNCRPKNILRRNLLMHGRSLSPVHRTIKNKLQSKISKGGSSSNLPSLTSPNISQYTNDSTTTDYFTRPERSQTSTSLMNDRLGTSTPTQKTEGIFANHHVAVDFTAASTSSGMTRDVCLATENSSIPDSSLEKKLGDISFQGLRRGRKLDI